MASTVDVPKDAEGNDLPVLGLFEHPEHHAQVWAHTPADVVQYQAEGWRPVETAKVTKATAATEKAADKEAAGGK